MNLEEGKKILRENKELKLILIKSGKIIYKSNKRGIAPMYEIATQYREEARDGIILDRVIGRGAAMLASYIGIGEVYGELLSNGAKEILESKGIKYTYSEDTPYIQNRDKTDYCPIEKLSMKSKNEKILLEQVGKFLEEINNRNWF